MEIIYVDSLFFLNLAADYLLLLAAAAIAGLRLRRCSGQSTPWRFIFPAAAFSPLSTGGSVQGWEWGLSPSAGSANPGAVC